MTARAASPVRVTADPRIANPRQPQAVVDEQGAIYIAFGAGEAVYCAVSSDGGKNYKKLVKIGDVNKDGGSIANTAAGEVTTIWRRDQQIYITRHGEIGEEKLGSGLQPWMTATPSGAWSIWVNRRGGDLWLLSPSARQPIKLAGTAWEPIAAVWESGSGTDTAIFSAVVVAN